MTNWLSTNPFGEINPEPKRFASRGDATAWIDEHNLQAIPHQSVPGWIAVVPDARGVFGIVDPNTMVLLEDW